MRLILLMFLFLIAFTGYNQSLEKEALVTDRPGASDSPSVIPSGALQIETGVIYEKTKVVINGAGYDQSVVSFPNTLFRFGILDNMELRLLAGEYSITKTEVDVTKGYSPITLGAKFQVVKEKGLIPETSFLIHLDIPSGSAGFGPEFVNPNVAMSMSNTLGSNISLGYYFGAAWDIENQLANGKYSVSLGFVFGEKLGMYVELFGFTSINNSDQHMFDLGFTYLINPMIQLDLSAGISVYGEYYSFISSGISFRLFK